MLVGVTGFAQSGKDSTGNHLCRNWGFTRFAFADQLKALALEVNPIVAAVPEGTFPFSTSARLQTYVETVGWEEAKRSPEVRLERDRKLAATASALRWLA